LHASDLKLPPGVKVMLDPKEALASVVAPRAEKVEEAAAGAGSRRGRGSRPQGAAAAQVLRAGAAPGASAGCRPLRQAAGAKGAPAAGAKGAPAGKKEPEKKGK